MNISNIDINSITCSFIGLGLIGGSIVKALKEKYPQITILACDPDISSLELAKGEHMIKEGYTSLSPDLFECDILFLCAPVSNNDEMLLKIKEIIKADTIITDVGSVKQTTHQAINNAGLSNQYIGGHPMAGSEKTGYIHSNPLLLENAYYILTPSLGISEDKINLLKHLVKSIGAIPLVLDYNKHDYITAAISHLPHIISASLVNLVRNTDDTDGTMKMIAAGGFKDITRISSSSPVMWESICMTNAENIKLLLKEYISFLEKIQTDLDNKNSQNLYRLFNTAKEYRDEFSNIPSGPIKKIYAIHVDIPDIPGSLAQTANILALHELSIKNIGIIHSREFQEGVLRIEFYDELTEKAAMEILKEHSYTIYE